VSAPPEWDDDVADLIALVLVGCQDSAEPGWREALRAVYANCDRDGLVAAAVKLLAELVTDLGMCPECFREYALRAIARA
jgi:hypothetical protein